MLLPTKHRKHLLASFALLCTASLLVGQESAGGFGVSLSPALHIPFLDSYDEHLDTAEVTPALHGNGSNIAFADGHVRYYDRQYMPDDSQGFGWDGEMQQWYNYVFENPDNDTERMLDRSIAITP